MATKKTDQGADEAPVTIYSRFINARKAFGKATKNAKNSRSTYADLSSVLDAVDAALNDNGLFIHQVVNEQTLHTMIVDEEGNTLDFGHMPILASKNDAQGYGSGLTYARRYSIMAACGIAPEDDDGAKAVESAPHALQEARQAKTRSPQSEVLMAGITALVDDLQNNAGIDRPFWGSRYGMSVSQMDDHQLQVVSADMKHIRSNFNGMDFIQPFGGFN